MPKRYGREFGRDICERLVAGERISKLSEEAGVSPATLHLWKRQTLIDAGLLESTKSVEVDELAQARQIIEELEAELAAVKAASALFNGEDVRQPSAWRYRPATIASASLPRRSNPAWIRRAHWVFGFPRDLLLQRLLPFRSAALRPAESPK